jgi:hypothetical protein
MSWLTFDFAKGANSQGFPQCIMSYFNKMFFLWKQRQGDSGRAIILSLNNNAAHK